MTVDAQVDAALESAPQSTGEAKRRSESGGLTSLGIASVDLASARGEGRRGNTRSLPEPLPFLLRTPVARKGSGTERDKKRAKTAAKVRENPPKADRSPCLLAHRRVASYPRGGQKFLRTPAGPERRLRARKFREMIVPDGYGDSVSGALRAETGPAASMRRPQVLARGVWGRGFSGRQWAGPGARSSCGAVKTR